jgi:hypothetical protein
MGVYAGLGVREVWRFDGAALHVGRLAAGAYEETPESGLLPFLPLADALPILQQAAEAEDDGAGMRLLREWVRTVVRPRYDAWRAQQPPPTTP